MKHFLVLHLLDNLPSRRRRVEELACMESIRLSKVRVRLSDNGQNDRAKPFVLDRRGRRSLRVCANKVQKSFGFSISFRLLPPHKKYPKTRHTTSKRAPFYIRTVPFLKVLGKGGGVWGGGETLLSEEGFPSPRFQHLTNIIRTACPS